MTAASPASTARDRHTAPPSDGPAAPDSMPVGRAVWLVARREIVERAKDRSFAVSTVMTLLIIIGVTIVPNLLGFGGPPTHEVGVVGQTATFGEAVAATAVAFDAEVELTDYPDAAAAEAAVADGDVDVVLLPGPDGAVEAVADSALGTNLELLLQTAWRGQVQAAEAEAAGLDPAAAQALLDPPPLATRALDGEERSDLVGVAFLAMFVLYGQLFGYGFWVAMGIVEEKSTRVVEVLLSAIRPRQLLAGKIIGIGALAFAQLVGIAAAGLGIVVLTGVVELPAGTIPLLAQVLLWFLLGFSFYACLFAMAGSLVSRQEEVQNVMTPITMLILVAFFSAFAALNDPSGLVARIASFLPISAPLVMPIRVAHGAVGMGEVLAAIVITLAAAAALVPLAARIYQGAILRTGARTRLADAWRSRG